MKASRPILRSTQVILLSSLFAASALAGPGPEYWLNRAAKPAPKTAAKAETPIAAKCGDCKTTPIRVMVHQTPTGKGTPTWANVGSKHSCASCTGTTTVVNGKINDRMTHRAGCVALVCCK